MNLCDMTLEIFPNDGPFFVRQFAVTAVTEFARSELVDRYYSAVPFQLRL